MSSRPQKHFDVLNDADSKEYRFVGPSGSYSLSLEVNKLLSHGWKCDGPPVSAGGVCVVQRMVRYKPAAVKDAAFAMYPWYEDGPIKVVFAE